MPGDDTIPLGMRLTEIGIRSFRSLYAAELSLKPLTLIIGPNGSGKSNLFKALRFLHVGVAGDIKEWRAYDALSDDLVWYGEDRSGSFAIAIGFGKSAFGYEATFQAAGEIEVVRESVVLEGASPPTRSLRFERVKDEITAQGALQIFVRSPNLLVLRDVGAGSLEAISQSIYEHIAGWRFFDVNTRFARQGQFISPDPAEVPPLEPDASNLSAFLYALQRLRPDDFAAVLEAVRRSIDLPEGLVVEHDAERGGRQARYRFIERPFGADHPIPPESMSDGTIRLLAHMALLLADRTVTLACLEEPDSGLHPSLMIHLADALRQAAAERQVLVTTHSPELMDCFDLAEEQESLQVYVAERNELGQTRFLPMTATEFAPWLEKYRLGEAVRRRFV
jgi:predicted ATPase